jgi:hypothetical protein
MEHPSLVPPPPHGRQTRRLTPKFRITSVHVEDGLDRRLLGVCGVGSAVRWIVGNAVHRHACGVYGPIAREDRILNAYLLAAPVEHSAPHHVVSVHPVGTVWLQISTVLGTGETTVRWCPPPSGTVHLNSEALDE